jgi:hypothetical protein
MFGSNFLLDVLTSKHCSCWSCIKHLLIKNYQYENHDRNNNMNVMFFLKQEANAEAPTLVLSSGLHGRKIESKVYLHSWG